MKVAKYLQLVIIFCVIIFSSSFVYAQDEGKDEFNTFFMSLVQESHNEYCEFYTISGNNSFPNFLIDVWISRRFAECLREYSFSPNLQNIKAKISQTNNISFSEFMNLMGNTYDDLLKNKRYTDVSVFQNEVIQFFKYFLVKDPSFLIGNDEYEFVEVFLSNKMNCLSLSTLFVLFLQRVHFECGFVGCAPEDEHISVMVKQYNLNPQSNSYNLHWVLVDPLADVGVQKSATDVVVQVKDVRGWYARRISKLDFANYDIVGKIQPMSYSYVQSLFLVNRSLRWYKSGKIQKAKEYLLKALKLNQYSVKAYYNLGVFSLKEGNYRDASYYFVKSILIDENFPQAYYQLAMSELNLKHVKSAIRFFQLSFAKIQEQEKKSLFQKNRIYKIKIHDTLSKLLFEVKQYNKSLVSCTYVINCVREHPLYLFNGENTLVEGVTFDTLLAKVYCRRALVNYQLGNNVAALSDIKQSLQYSQSKAKKMLMEKIKKRLYLVPLSNKRISFWNPVSLFFKQKFYFSCNNK